MDLPVDLLRQVREGRVVLFLGAGATRNALTPEGKEPPLGNDLRDRIARQFLTGDYTSESLAWVAELAISAADLFTVQDFIAKQFSGLRPADFHCLIPTFRWRGIATTNYDRVVETVYETSRNPVQSVVPFLSNADRVDVKLRDLSSVALLKLHGCITRTHDQSLPLILTIDQYATHRENRTRVFQMLEEWASENTIIFVGHALHDPNLRGLLLDLSQRIPSRPRYYLVRPGISEVERDFWNGKYISTLNGTFEDLLRVLDAAIAKDTRPLLARLEADQPIRIRFVVKDEPSPALLDFLTNDAEYVHEGVSSSMGSPSKFYSGFGLGWYPILAKLDVPRQLTDRLLLDVILRPEEDRPSLTELYLIKAEAGAGKSIFLRRLAWEAATNARVLCLRGRGTTPPSYEALRELSHVTGERIFVFIDNAADHASTILEMLEFARSRKIRLTVITAERINEWNVRCEVLEEYLSDQYQLRYLSRSEIEVLVRLLEEHRALGPNLEGKTFEERVIEFEEKAGRQLLVALHEATRGLPFEEIILDEYRGIIPLEAQRLYLTVCVLNRLRVPVRAGLISRIHGIPFEQFQERLFKPLEHVIHVVKLPWGDYAYVARHPEIAQMVFAQALVERTERFNEYIRIVRSLNPIFSVDREALWSMLRAKVVHALFPNYEDGKAIYDSAKETLGDDAHLFQQQANYERIRPDGNLRLARTLLEKAREKEPSDSTIMHTLAEVIRSQAEQSYKPLERARYRAEARSVLRKTDRSEPHARYSMVTLLKLAIDEIRDLLLDESSRDREIDEAVRNAEREFEIGRQKYPGDEYVLIAESEFAKLLQDHERCLDALKRAHQSNPRDPFIASRLASILLSRGEKDKARGYLEEALASNGGDKRLNFQYAELLRTETGAPPDSLSYYYRRAFSKWDENYESQFWYARFTFESSDPAKVSEAKEVFRHLRNAPMSHRDRIRMRDSVGGLSSPIQFSGTVNRIEAAHGFVTVDGREDSVFFHENDMTGDTWKRLSTRARVVFMIGFTLRGPRASNLRLESSTI
jgi:tetratricopeptide (TPR) repeat protein/cold shock CspA family protein